MPVGRCRWSSSSRSWSRLIPTTIGGLLSAIGIAGMDRLVRYNVLAMSGRAVEAAGDVDTLLLDKTGTITLGNRMATEFVPMPGVSEEELADAAQLASLSERHPRDVPSSCWRKKSMACVGVRWPTRNAQFIPFTAQTRMSGVNVNGTPDPQRGDRGHLTFVREERRRSHAASPS